MTRSAIRVSTLVAVALVTMLVATRGVAQLQPPAYAANASQADSPHRINEVSMIAVPTFDYPSRTLIDYVYAAYMRYPTATDSPYSIKVASGKMAGGGWTQSTLPLPYWADNAGDPVLASNPTSFEYAPNRMYLAGRTWVGSTPHTDQISVWTLHADYYLPQWTFQAGLGFDPGVFDTHDVDKPAIAVSTYAGTRGHAYLIYLRVGGGEASTIQFSRNTFNDTWDSPHAVYTAPSTSDALQGIRLDVDPGTGLLYLSFLNWTAGTVNVRVSSDEGTTWSPLYTTPAAGLLTNNNGFVSCSGCIFSPSFLMSTFNGGANSLALVYHRRRPGGGAFNSEVVMRQFYLPAGCFSPEVRVSGLNAEQPSLHDQWQGAVACANDGTCVVSYYDHLATEGTIYRLYDRRVNNDGTPLRFENDVLLHSPASNAGSFVSNRMEYHDVFQRNSVWYTVGVISTPSENTSDVWVTSQ